MADKIQSLWKRMAEMFGGKALETKFGPTPPDTWRIAIDRLNDFELQRGMRRLVYGGKPHIPTLPEFLRMCREVGGDYEGEPVPPSHRLEAPAVSRWSEQANLHLMAYLWRKSLAGIHYATPRMRVNPVPSHDHESSALIQPLVDAKNAWAEDMRERENEGATPADNGRALWREYMTNAEKAVAFVRQQEAAA